MNIKSYILLAILIVISAVVLLKDALTSHQHIGSHHKALIVNGVQLTVKVDVYQNAKGRQRFEVSNPIQIKPLKLAVNK